MNLLEQCAGLPLRSFEAGELLVVEGADLGAMYVLVEGSLEVAAGGTMVATISEPGAVIGEMSALLGIAPTATVTATAPSEVRVIGDPAAFLSDEPDGVLLIARMLAARLARLTGYLSDIKAQYGDVGGNLGLIDEVLSELTFGEQPPVESGSDRDPNPRY